MYKRLKMSHIKNDLRKIFNEIAQSYAYSRLKPWPIVLEVMKENSRVIGDIGCGPGHNTQFLLEKHSKIEVIGLDISYGMIKIAKKRMLKRGLYSRFHPVEADTEHLPFREKSFDGLAYIAVIHHLPSSMSRINALKDAFRVLKENGRIVITVWALIQGRFLPTLIKNVPLRILGLRQNIGDVFIPWRTQGKVLLRFYHLFLPWELIEITKQAGFKILKRGSLKIKARILPENYYIIGCKRT